MADQAISQLSDADLLALSRQRQLSGIPTAALQAAAAQNAAAAKGAPTAADRVQAGESGILRGAAYLAATPADTIANLKPVGTALYDLGAHFIGGQDWADLPRPSQPFPAANALTSAMDKSPITTTQLSRPDDPASRYISAGASALPAAIAGGNGVGSMVRNFIGAQPSIAAGQTMMERRPFDSDVNNQTASALVQALSGAAVPGATKLALRGGPSGAATMQDNMSAFRDTGAEPTLAQATGGRGMRFLQSGLEKMPGSSGVFAKAAENQAEDLRGGVENVVDQVAPGGTSPEIAGRAIEQGITGPGGFRSSFNAKAGQLYDAVDQHIAPDTPASVSNTMSVLDAIAKPNPKAPATTAALVNPKVAGIRQALQSDLGEDGTTLPYSTLSDLRSRVGEMLSGSELTTDIPRAQVKRLYGGLSQDLQGAAQAAGPDAVAAFNRANTYYRAGMNRMDVLSNVLDRNGGPEAIYNAALSGTKSGATQLRSITRSLDPDQQGVLAATVFKRMGQATAGAQNAAGDVFSPETFLTNWNRMSPEAKSALFDRFPDLQDQASNLATVGENLKAGSKVFRNASGTGAAEQQTHTIRDVLIGSLLSGEGGHMLMGPHGLALAAAPLAAAGGANLLARGMTSPTMVDWAARPTLGSGSQFASGMSVAPNMRPDQQRLIDALNAR